MLSRAFRHGYRALIGGVLFFNLPGLLSAPKGTPHAKVSLVSEQASIQPGHTFRLGVRFLLEKNWHIYWLNPGDSGEPPRVEWEVPPQFHATPLEWPTPQRLENGPLVDYGYENEVLLLSTVHASANLKAGSDVHLRAEVKWLVCHDICIPEQQTVEVSMPVAAGPPKLDSRWRELFARTKGQVPSRLPPAWSVTAVSKAESFVLSIKTGVPESNAAFFPLNPLQIENAAPQLTRPFQRGVRLSLRKSQQLLRPVVSLKGVLVLRQRKGYEIDVPVASIGKSEKSLH